MIAMKKLIALLLTLALLLPCCALAEQMDSYALEDVGVSFAVPSAWHAATAATAGNCSLGEAFQLSEDEVLTMLNDLDVSFYAVCDDYGIVHAMFVSTPGIAGVDMRDHNLDMDYFMTGFLRSYDNVQDSGVYQTGAATFAYVHYLLKDASGSSDIAQFVTNVDGQMCLFQIMSLYGVPLEEHAIDQLRQVVDTVTFMD